MDDPENDAFNDILFDGIQNRETRLYREVPFKNMIGDRFDLAVTTSFLRKANARDEEAGIVVVFKDITESKALERARHRIINHLSHELKTPLSIISTSIALDKSAMTPKSYARIKRNLERLQDIQTEVEDIIDKPEVAEIRKLLPALEQALDLIELMAQEEPMHEFTLKDLKKRIQTLFKTDTAVVEILNISILIPKMVDLAKRLSSHRDIIFATHIEEDIHLSIVPEAFEKAVMGLLKNAIENTPDGGDISISLSSEQTNAIFEVKDAGIGITAESRQQIFGGFYYAQDTSLYSTKKPFDFGAGGKGLDLLRTKIFSEMYNFQIDCQTTRCRYIPLETDLCPGHLRDCTHIDTKAQCAQSGGSVFRLIFARLKDL
jgi:signal transduction histidine kinase